MQRLTPCSCRTAGSTRLTQKGRDPDGQNIRTDVTACSRTSHRMWVCARYLRFAGCMAASRADADHGADANDANASDANANDRADADNAAAGTESRQPAVRSGDAPAGNRADRDHPGGQAEPSVSRAVRHADEKSGATV